MCVTNKNICISVGSFVILVYGRIEAADDRDYMCELSLISRDLEHAIGHRGWVFLSFPGLCLHQDLKIYLRCVLIKCMKTLKREAGKVQHPAGHGEADREADYTLS